MDANAVHTDLMKALSLVAKKHDIRFTTETKQATNEMIRFSITMGEQITQDMREYLAVATPEMKRGHDSFKHRKPGLSDDMLGKRFVIRGEEYIYLGCIAKRPSYPVSALRVKGGSYRQLKCHMDYLDDMIKQHTRRVEKQRQREAELRLKTVDPELSAEANFS